MASRKMGSVTIRRGKSLADVSAEIKLIAGVEVLVGFPAETSNRDESEAAEVGGITNAALGYIHETGMPEQNIPARPFLVPAIEENAEMIEKRLAGIARKALSGDAEAIEAGFQALGLKMQAAIRNKINEGIPPPLAESTLRARAARGRKGAQEELDARGRGEAPGVANAKPLVDSGQMRNAVNYAIRNRSKRS